MVFAHIKSSSLSAGLLLKIRMIILVTRMIRVPRTAKHCLNDD